MLRTHLVCLIITPVKRFRHRDAAWNPSGDPDDARPVVRLTIVKVCRSCALGVYTEEPAVVSISPRLSSFYRQRVVRGERRCIF